MTVRRNLAFALKLRKVSKAEIERRINDALNLVGLDNMADRYPFQMSGGQQQRVALARAVVAEPRVLLLDEPLSNLDAKVREQARFWLREFQQRLGITAVYVTHDQGEALAISDRIAVLSGGRLLQYGTPTEIYERPATRFVADFIGRNSFLDGEIVEHSHGLASVQVTGDDILSVTAPTEYVVGERVTVAIRSERIRFVDSASGTPNDSSLSNVIAGQVISSVYLGSLHEFHVSTSAGIVNAEAPYYIAPGPVTVHLPPDAIVLLPPDERLESERA